MATYPFLSPEWIEAAKQVRKQHTAAAPGSVTSLRMNLTVDDVPGSSGSVDAHVDTSGGGLDLDLGHLDQPDVKVSLDYATAKAVLIDGDGEAAMSAFMAGRIHVEGDMTKLLAYQAAPPSPEAIEVAAALRAITSAD